MPKNTTEQPALLNLARSLRPQTFSQIKGQSLTIKMLQNSLYLGRVFPAYLLAGQKGCGKTSTGRIFASALNCHNLSSFRTDPKKQAVPCLSCSSCKAMQQGSHPDFIEIDAASNTGVENIRSILETSSYLPLLGTHKIYLVDEAHMLSRSAFNALLKILEEPPPSVLFMLATTEPNKIPDTVRSRCFYAFFDRIAHNTQIEYLREICTDNTIDCDDKALALIAKESEGSLRDAINLLEQIAGTGEKITVALVRSILKISSTDDTIALIDSIVNKDLSKLLLCLNSNWTAHSLWLGIGQSLSALLRIKAGAPLPTDSPFDDAEQLKPLAEKCSKERIYALMQLFWGQEQTFLSTNHKQQFLEHLLTQMASQVNISPLATLKQSIESPASPSISKPTQTVKTTPVAQSGPLPQKAKPKPPAPPPAAITASTTNNISWQNILTSPDLNGDKLLHTIFKQVIDIQEQGTEQTLYLTLPTLNPFFESKIEETAPLWQSLLNKHYPPFKKIKLVQAKKEQTIDDKRAPKAEARKQATAAPNKTSRQTTGPLDISDKQKWPKANLITETFPGKIEVIK